MTRLSAATLAQLPAGVIHPGYDRQAVRPGVVHLGIGAFHRAHQAAVFDAAIAAGDQRWGITGVSLRSCTVRDQLAPQDGLYSIVERDGAVERVRIVGAVQRVLVAPEDPAAVVAALAHPDTHLVTLTITEKGYRLANGTLDRADPDVAHDLADLSAPRTAPGFLVAGLAARRRAGLGPFTTLSCDNLPHNGRLLREAVLTIARHHDAALAKWIADRATFPQSMVDRIVPATTAADVTAFADRVGVEDRAMVKTEPFLQWVIEDRFCGPRPDFAALGVQLTDDVAPWEEAKMRLLNGAHSGIAYLGGLAGIAPTRSPPTDRKRCRSGCSRRSRGGWRTGRQYRHWRSRLPAGSPWQRGRDDTGMTFRVNDPLAAMTTRVYAEADSAAAQVDALLAIDRIVPAQLAANLCLRMMTVERLQSLKEIGVIAALASYSGGTVL